MSSEAFKLGLGRIAPTRSNRAIRNSHDKIRCHFVCCLRSRPCCRCLVVSAGRRNCDVCNIFLSVSTLTCMKTPTGSKIKAFLIGMVAGFLAYIIYLNSFAEDDTSAIAIGWIYFAPQYLVFWAVTQFDLSETAALVSCYAIIMLLYGYIALSIRLWPKTAIWTFLIAALSFLMIVYWASFLLTIKSLAILIKFPLWPAYLLDISDDGSHTNLVRITIECISVAFWYAALICCVRTSFMPFGKAKGNRASAAPSEKQPDGGPVSQMQPAIASASIPK